MPDDAASDEPCPVLDELRAILDAITVTAERLYDLPDGSVAR